MKKVMWIIVCIDIVAVAVALSLLPDVVPMHYNFAGEIDRWGSKFEELILPGIMVIFALCWTLFLRYYEKKVTKLTEEKEIKSTNTNIKVLGITGVALTIIWTGLMGVSIYNDFTTATLADSTSPLSIARVSTFLCSLLLIVFGNILPKTRVNSTVGLRTPWSMYNDETWRRSNKVGGYSLIVVGILSVITAAIVTGEMTPTLFMLAYLIIDVFIMIWYSHKVYKEEKKKESAQSAE